MIKRPTALITGASTGIGRRIAYVAARDGYGVSVECVAADLSERGGCQTLLDAVAPRSIDVLVNNAGRDVPQGDAVGNDAWHACIHNRRVVVHGLKNKFNVFAMRLLPRTLQAKVVKQVTNRRRSQDG